MKGLLRTATALGVAAGMFGAASAISPVAVAQDGFLKGKQVSLVVGSPPGGGYDAYARTVGQFIGTHLPGNPTIVIRNMPGSGSQQMMNWLYNVAPKDGTAIGAPQNGTAFEPMFHILSQGGKTAKFDGTRFNWIGSAAQDIIGTVVWHTSQVKSVKDLQDKGEIFGSTGPNTDNGMIAVILNNLFKAKIKIVSGHQGSNSLMMALERGEVFGVAGMPYSSLSAQWDEWIRSGKLRFLVQVGMEKHPKMKDVPFAFDLLSSKEDRDVLELLIAKLKMSRPYMLPPGVDADRITAWRRSFDALMADKTFLAAAEKRRLEITPVKGEEVQAMVEKLYKTPEPLVVKARAILGSDKWDKKDKK